MDWHVYLYGWVSALFAFLFAVNLRRGDERQTQYSGFLFVWVLCIALSHAFPAWENLLAAVGFASAVIGAVCLLTGVRLSRLLAKDG